MYRHQDSISDDGFGAVGVGGGSVRRSSGLPKNNSDNCLTIQVPSLFENSDGEVSVPVARNAHSSPTNPSQRRRYSQGAILDVFATSQSLSSSYDVDSLRHASLRDVSAADTNPFSSTIHLMDQESSIASGSASVTSSETRRKVTRTPQERLNKLAKRPYWPEDNLVPLDDICESPLVKTPKEPVEWAAAVGVGGLRMPMYPVDSSGSLQGDKG